MMGVRRGPVHISEAMNPMLEAAKDFDMKNAVNRMRGEGMDALRLGDGRVPSPMLHKLRLAVTLIDEVREDLKKNQLEKDTK